MTNEQQRTFGETVGLEPIVPTRRHSDDLVECSDGSLIAHSDVWYDCRDNPHSTEAGRELADLTIVEEILQSRADWAREYATENDDFTSGYDHCVTEDNMYWPNPISEWISDYQYNGSDIADLVLELYRDGRIDLDLSSDDGDEFDDDEYVRNVMSMPSDDDLVAAVCDDLDGRVLDAEWEYSHNEYAVYSGSGCCLWGFDIGEQEEQVDISAHDEFVELHSQGRLRDLLDSANTDAYVSLSSWSLRGDYPCFEFYHNPGGRWDCIVSAERMEEALMNALERLCGS